MSVIAGKILSRSKRMAPVPANAKEHCLILLLVSWIIMALADKMTGALEATQPNCLSWEKDAPCA